MKKMKVFLLSAAILVVAVVLTTGVKSMNAAGAPEIKIDNFSFGPASITVPVGTPITWANHDDVPHVIASVDNLFKSKPLDTDDRFSFTFTKPGTYEYFCAIHPRMTGTVVVQ